MFTINNVSMFVLLLNVHRVYAGAGCVCVFRTRRASVDFITFIEIIVRNDFYVYLCSSFIWTAPHCLCRMRVANVAIYLLIYFFRYFFFFYLDEMFVG